MFTNQNQVRRHHPLRLHFPPPLTRCSEFAWSAEHDSTTSVKTLHAILTSHFAISGPTIHLQWRQLVSHAQTTRAGWKTARTFLVSHCASPSYATNTASSSKKASSSERERSTRRSCGGNFGLTGRPVPLVSTSVQNSQLCLALILGLALRARVDITCITGR